MSSPPSVQYASRTDKGMRRAMNQDSLQVRICNDTEEWRCCGHLFVVADGMGGHAVGDLASRIAIETLPLAYFKNTDAATVESRMREAIVAANKAINDRGRVNREFEGMGTTCSVLSLSKNGALVGHVGDSRVYRVRSGRIEQLTFDHSLQWEMIRLGRATPENVELFHPRNVITRCLGPDPHVQVDIEGPFSVEPGDQFLLCSDGLTNHVNDSEIGQIVGSMPPTDSSRLLINLANCRGGSDNSTVVVIEIDSYPQSTTGETLSAFTPAPQVRTSEMVAVRSSKIWKTLLTIAAIICLVSGIFLAFIQNNAAAAVLVAASFFAWLIRRRLSRNDANVVSMDVDADPLPQLDNSEVPEEPSEPQRRINAMPESSSISRSAFLPTSPYRVINSELSEALLSNLAEIQSDLVQAARDSGWKVDFEELTNLNRQAVQSQQAQKLDRAIKSRGKAIDLLMKELYLRSRPN